MTNQLAVCGFSRELSNGFAHETEEKRTLSHEYSTIENSQPIGLRGSSLESRDVETNSFRNPRTQSSPGGGWVDPHHRERLDRLKAFRRKGGADGILLRMGNRETPH